VRGRLYDAASAKPETGLSVSTSRAAVMPIEIRLLGPFEVQVGERLSGPPGARQTALLVLLALEVGRVVSVQRILDEIWGDELPSDPANAVQARVSGLRKVFGPGVLAAQGGGYRLDLVPEAVDVVRFERGIARGRELLTGGDAQAAAATLRASLERWRGAPLDGLRDLDFARNEATRLEELRLKAIEDCIDAELRLGRHADLIPELKELTGTHPLSEGLAAQLMLSLYRCGRQVEALQVYRELSLRMLDELGLEPGPRLRNLESAILRQEPDLLLAGAPSEPPAAPVLDPLTRVRMSTLLARELERRRQGRVRTPGSLVAPGLANEDHEALLAASIESPIGFSRLCRLTCQRPPHLGRGSRCRPRSWSAAWRR
jgi:DNA-binding SARP family transcriptional activator